MTTNEPTRQIAMLIDGDNAQPSLLGSTLEETVRHGIVTTRRIYGDWTESTMKQWKELLHDNAVQPIQQFRFTTGKNATDSALIIDAMDLLHGGSVSGFCLVSSDSDYTRLATRIREAGLFVMGIGRSTTPKSFVNACEVFVYTENLAPEPKPTARRSRGKKTTSTEQPVDALVRAVEMAAQEDGWASLGAVGTYIRQLDPGFDPRTYGHKQLSQVVRSSPDVIEVRETKTRGGPVTIHVRLKPERDS